MLKRLATQFAAEGQVHHWEQKMDAKFVRVLPQPEGTHSIDLFSMQMHLIQLGKPTWNNLGRTAA